MSVSRGQVTVREWLWVLAWALVLMTFTSLPYLWGWHISSPEQVFSGFMYNVEDCNSYIAKMQQGARGDWLFHLTYTPEEHKGGLVFLFHIILGKVAVLFGWPLVTTYHLTRLLLIPVLLAAVYHFVAYLTAWRAVRGAAMLLVAFGSGFGWLWVVSGQPPALGAMPIDLWVPDGITFLTYYAFPHLSFSQALMLWALRWGLQALDEPSWQRGLAAGLVTGLASLVHPFVAPVVVALLGLYALWQSWRRRQAFWRRATVVALMGLSASPYLCYLLTVFSTNPVLGAWSAQNLSLSPAPIHYLLGYGLVGLLAIGGGIYVLRRGDERQAFLVIWALTVPLLVYLPFKLQRRVLMGYQVPLATLAAFGLVRYMLLPLSRWRPIRWLTRFPRYTLPRLRRFAVAVIVLATLPTNLLLVLGHIGQVSQRVSPVFHPGAVVRAVDWLGRHTDPDKTVLAAFRTGNYIPTRAGNRVFVGHGSETVDSEAKQEVLRRFFSADADDTLRRDLLRGFGIVYVFHGPYERALGGFQAADAAYLKPVYEEDGIVIYQVDNE